MKHDDKFYLQYTLDDSMVLIFEFVKDAKWEDFVSSFLMQDAVLRRIGIVGEAVKNVSDPVKDAHPEIPWRRIIATRNIIIQ